MGLTDLLRSAGPAGQITRGVYGQFIDLKRRNPEMSEEEIAKALFLHGYSTGKSLNKMERIRINKYFENDSSIISIIDLCMAIIDIELNITARDNNAFEMAKNIIVTELNKLGYAPAPVRDSHFVAYKKETAVDKRTNLMWAAKDNGSDINWADARSYCHNYRGGGYTDWRMPTQEELAGLYEIGRNNNLQVSTWFIWASETRGSEAAIFYFLGGHRLWNLQSSVYDRRALPVRSSK